MADDQPREVPQDRLPIPQIKLGSSPEDSCRESSSSSEKAIEGGESSTDSRKRSSPFMSGPDSNNPMSVPSRSRSSYAAVYTDQSSGAISKRRAYEFPVDSSGERASSANENHSVTYTELLLSQSSDSDNCVPMPDVEVAEDNLMTGRDALQTVCENVLASIAHNINQVYVKPTSSQTCSPDNAEVKPSNSVEDEPNSSQSSSPDTVEEVKPDIEVAEENLIGMDDVQTACKSAITSLFLNIKKFLETEERDLISLLGASPDTAKEVVPSTAESEQDPMSSQSSTPDTAKRTGEDKPMFYQACSPDNAEEVKPILEDEPMTSQSNCPDTVEEVKPDLEVTEENLMAGVDALKTACEAALASTALNINQAYVKPMSSQTCCPDNAKVKPSKSVEDEPKSSKSSSPDTVEEVKPEIEETEENLIGMDDVQTACETVLTSIFLNIKKFLEEERDRISVFGVSTDTAREVIPSTAESEQDPMSSQSSNPDTAIRTGEDEPVSSQTSSLDNVEEVKPMTVEDEPMTSQSSISG